MVESVTLCYISLLCLQVVLVLLMLAQECRRPFHASSQPEDDVRVLVLCELLGLGCVSDCGPLGLVPLAEILPTVTGRLTVTERLAVVLATG